MCSLSALLPHKRGAHRSFPASPRPLRRSQLCILRLAWPWANTSKQRTSDVGHATSVNPRPCCADVHGLPSGPALRLTRPSCYSQARATGSNGPGQLVSARGCSVVNLCCDRRQPRHRMRALACSNRDLAQQCGGVRRKHVPGR